MTKKYIAPQLANLLFASLPALAEKVDTIQTRYDTALTDATGTDGATIKVDPEDFSALLSIAMSAIMIMKEQREGETVKDEAMRMLNALGGGLGELENFLADEDTTAEPEDTDDLPEHLPQEVRAFINEMQAAGHNVTVREVELG